MSFGSSAPEVEPADPAPTRDTAQVQETANRERQRRLSQKGRAATILSAKSREQPATASKQLLGS